MELGCFQRWNEPQVIVLSIGWVLKPFCFTRDKVISMLIAGLQVRRYSTSSR